MEEDIAMLRKEALNTLASKGSHYRMDDVYGSRSGFSSLSKRGKRLTTPELTREVIGAFGMKPRSRYSHTKDRSRLESFRHHRSQKSPSSSISSRSSQSHSVSFSSYSSSRSHSRSGSHSSSTSTYSRSSSYSQTSRSSSAKSEQVTTHHKVGIKRSLTRHGFDSTQHSYDRQFLDGSNRNKKAKYSDPISLSPNTFRNEHSKSYKHMQFKDPHPREHYTNSRERVIEHKPREQNSRTTEYNIDEFRYSKQKNSLPKALYPALPKRHSSNTYAVESRSTRHSSPPHIYSRSHANKLRLTEQRERSFQRKDSPLSDVKYYRRNPSHVESISSPLYKRKDKDLQSYHSKQQRHSEKQSFRNVLEQDLRFDSEPKRNRSLETHVGKREDRRKYRDKYVIVEDGADFRTSRNHPTSNSDGKWRSQKAKEVQKADVQISRMKRSYPPGISRTNPSTDDKEETVKVKMSRKTNETESELIEKVTEQLSEENNIIGESEYVEELDYNEDMDNLDVHPTGHLEDADAIENISSKHDSNHCDQCSDSDNRKFNNERSCSASSPSDKCKDVSDTENVGQISSPIRVSPDGNGRQPTSSSRSREKLWSRSGRLPVKQRLYLSKQKIEAKKRNVAAHLHKCKSPELRELSPSLANRLGPPHQQMRRSNDLKRPKPSGRQPKGDAVAIAEAYRRKRQQRKIIHIRKEIPKQRNSKSTSRSQQKLDSHEGFGEDSDKELELDMRIHHIKEKNKAILKRKKEIEKDKQKYS